MLSLFSHNTTSQQKHWHQYRQSGFALLMMVVVVFGVGTLGATLMADHAKSQLSRALSPLSTADRRLLTGARQSLISYAALYHFMYGPRGAGSGHLPCPDTDDFVPAWQSSLSDNRIASGGSPNPPCGRSAVAQGYLPRHIRMPAQRYAFHAEPSQIAIYQVAGQVINNPVNRVVNPSIVDMPSQAAEVAAVISLPVIHSGKRSASVVVSFDALLSGVRPAVAAWIIGKVESLTLAWCRVQPALDEGQHQVQAISTTISALQCHDYRSRLESCPLDTLLLLLVDNLPASDGCAVDAIEQLTIDGIPAIQHWFLRNQWLNWIDIRSTTECMKNPDDVCQLQLIRAPDNQESTVLSASLDRIVLQWAVSQ